MFNIFKRKAAVITQVSASGGSVAAGGDINGVALGQAKRDEYFEAWPKTKHIDKVLGGVTVTEKIDGTNACVVFEEDGYMYVQSRNRIITPAADNQGFARWAYRHQKDLFHILGPGRHFGEWWGKGIGRKYDMQHNVFSVFNNGRFYKTLPGDPLDSMATRTLDTGIFDQVSAVPHIFSGEYNSPEMNAAIAELANGNSLAARQYNIEYPDPEGVCFYFREFDKVAKLVFANPGKHKWEA